MIRLLFIFILSGIVSSQLFSWELTGSLGSENRFYTHSAQDPLKPNHWNPSFFLEPELYHEWDHQNQSLTITPYVRWDHLDDERTHFDVRELFWLYVGDQWELRVGVNKIFWGVTESVHLVDIINQTDFVEQLDQEDKLGQPMIQATFILDWGIWDFIILPYFRERNFLENKNRISFGTINKYAEYESRLEEWHPDWAMRYSHTFGYFDLGLSYFNGTNREPRFLFNQNQPITPRYDLIWQTSMDLQWTYEGWLLKTEWIYRDSDYEQFHAMATGFEYTLVGIFNSKIDLGLIGEILWDERGDALNAPLSHDLFLGSRWVLNDVHSSEILAGCIKDIKNDSLIFSVEASRRIGNDWKISFEARFFSQVEMDSTFAIYHQDDYIQLELVRFF